MDGGLSKVEPSLKERIFASCRLSSCKIKMVRIQIKASIHLLSLQDEQERQPAWTDQGDISVISSFQNFVSLFVHMEILAL